MQDHLQKDQANDEGASEQNWTGIIGFNLGVLPAADPQTRVTVHLGLGSGAYISLQDARH